MKLQKEEIREDILKAAEKEFLIHGFNATSMRVIAKKANTSLGNLYNYFESKEDIYIQVIGSTIEDIENMFNEHVKDTKDNKNDFDMNIINVILEKSELNKLGLNLFISRKFIILMEGSKGTKYEGYKERFLEMCKEHFLWHLDNRDGNGNFIEIVANSFLNGILFIAKRSENINDAKEDFIKLYKLICSGILSQLK